MSDELLLAMKHELITQSLFTIYYLRFTNYEKSRIYQSWLSQESRRQRGDDGPTEGKWL